MPSVREYDPAPGSSCAYSCPSAPSDSAGRGDQIRARRSPVLRTRTSGGLRLGTGSFVGPVVHLSRLNGQALVLVPWPRALLVGEVGSSQPLQRRAELICLGHPPAEALAHADRQPRRCSPSISSTWTAQWLPALNCLFVMEVSSRSLHILGVYRQPGDRVGLFRDESGPVRRLAADGRRAGGRGGPGKVAVLPTWSRWPHPRYSLTRAKKLAIIVVDSGLVVDSVDYSAPNQPQNPNQPRSSPGWAHHGAPGHHYARW